VTTPAVPAPTPEPAPEPQGKHVVRVGVHNPATAKTTFIEVHHVADGKALRALLADLGVPSRQQLTGTGGHYTTERRKIVWRDMDNGALKEFVCGGDVYRLRSSLAGGWEAVHMGTEEITVAGTDPAEVEQRTRRDAASFHRALRS
jgi:hypothetical protein